MAILIAYYSRAGENYFGGSYRRIPVGNTRRVAEQLASLTHRRRPAGAPSGPALFR